MKNSEEIEAILWAMDEAMPEESVEIAKHQLSNLIQKTVIADLLALLPERKLIDIEIPDTLHRNIGFNQAIDQMETAIKKYCRRDG